MLVDIFIERIQLTRFFKLFQSFTELAAFVRNFAKHESRFGNIGIFLLGKFEEIDRFLNFSAGVVKSGET